MTIKITKDQIQEAVDKSASMAEAAILLGLHFSTFKTHAKKFGLYNPNQGLRGSNKPKSEGKGKFHLEDILNGKHPQYQSFKLKHALIKAGLKKNECEICGIKSWNNLALECELDHIDGNRANHKLENLRVLCPNCHSQTPTFRFKKR